MTKPVEMADGTLYPDDFFEYVRAIHAAPPGTLIRMGELQPVPWMRCVDCGAEMDQALEKLHECPRKWKERAF